VQSRWSHRVAFAAAWLVFLFLLLELAGFVAFAVVGVRTVAGYGYPTGLTVDHASLGWLYQPGFRGHFKGNLAYLDIPVRINATGFRDQPLGAKSAGSRRLVVIGDSVVFAPGVAAEDRFMEQLQARARRQGWPLEVRNLGVNGYTFAQYLELVRLDFFGLQPDGVLLGFTLNDIQERNWRGGDAGNGGGLARLRVRIGQFIDRLERSYASRFVDEVSTRVNLALTRDGAGLYHTKWMRSVVAYWRRDDARQRLGRELDELSDRLASAGVPFAVVIFPELNDVLQPETFSYPRETIVHMLEERRIAYCDPYPAFRAHAAARDLFLTSESVHYTPSGHALLADALLECVRSGRLGPLGTALASP
jgi:lysophospholipase L1-like esterase